MGHEELEEARAKRAEKEAVKAAKGKGKRGRKPKSVAIEADAGAGELLWTRWNTVVSARSLSQKHKSLSQRPKWRD